MRFLTTSIAAISALAAGVTASPAPAPAPAPAAQASAGTAAGCPTGYGFGYPNSTDPTQQNLQFTLGQRITVKWLSPWPAVKLAFIGEDSDTFIFIDQDESRSTFGWNVNVNNSKNDNNQYYLYIEDQNDNSQHCYSSLWSISDQNAAANGGSGSDSGSSSSAVAPSSTIVPTHTPSPTQRVDIVTSSGASGLVTVYQTQPPGSAGASASTATAAPNASPVSNGLSAGAKTGIGVGVTLGVLLLVGAAAAAFLLGRRQRRRQDEAANHSGSPGMSGPNGGPNGPFISAPMMGRGAGGMASPGGSTIPSYYENAKMPPSAYVGGGAGVGHPPLPPQELDPAAAVANKRGYVGAPNSGAAGGLQLHEMPGQAASRPASNQIYELDGGGGGGSGAGRMI